MAGNSFIFGIINSIFKRCFALEPCKDTKIETPKKVILIRQHNTLGEILSGVSLFRALKETYPELHLTLIINPFNYPGSINNKYLDRIIVLYKQRLLNPLYVVRLIRILREGYDIAIVPVVVTFSFLSSLLARISKATVRIGAESLNGNINPGAYFFDRPISLDWRLHPDSNVSERSLDIVRPFGINTGVYHSELSFNDEDLKKVNSFLTENDFDSSKFLIGLNVGMDNSPNCWSLIKYLSLIRKLHQFNSASFYLVGSRSDRERINFLRKGVNFNIGLFIDRPIPEIAALISRSHLFISNDTDIMHVAGTTSTPQVSIFGPTNPFNWAPLGPNKYFIRKSELIEDIAVDDVYQLCNRILERE